MAGWTRRRSSLFARSEPMVWMTGGALVVSLAMIVGLLVLVVSRGMGTFWPGGIVRLETRQGAARLGEVGKQETFLPAGRAGRARRRMIRTGNFELTGEHFRWVPDFEIESESRPRWAVLLERREWGRFYGVPHAFLIDGRPVVEVEEEGSAGDREEQRAAVWSLRQRHQPGCRDRFEEISSLKRRELGEQNRERAAAELSVRRAEFRLRRLRGAEQPDRAAVQAAIRQVADAKREFAAVRKRVEVETRAIEARIGGLEKENARYAMVLITADGGRKTIPLASIVRGYPANQLSLGGKLGVYLSRWWEFLSDDPREANSEGGVYPAIFGTVVMTLIMSVMVVPFGVLAALYLREYARQGPLVSVVRIAVNNLAGVPSIVFGVFGLGFFCTIIGGTLDNWFFDFEITKNPTFGKGGILWASLTLALLTLPVVIVATEEALAAVPRSMREGSYACGASKWQTIRRIVLPRAMPGVMTGMILAVARGAGEVAPLMLVGAVKLAPQLAVDGSFPYVHPERSFMHLGFQVYDLGFQSQNSEAARPMVFTTTLLLISIVVLLNIVAISIRARMRRALHA